MSYSAEFIVNVGPYQHVQLTVSGGTISQFMDNITRFDDNHKSQLGLFQAELESWVKTAHSDALNDAPVKIEVVDGKIAKVQDVPSIDNFDEAVELVKNDLGATEVDAVINETAERAAQIEMGKTPEAPWKRSVQPVGAKPWEVAPKAAAAGLEDF